MEMLLVYKNQYPYKTLHTIDCSVGGNARSVDRIGDARIARLDTIRIDYCKRCFGAEHWKHPAWNEMRSLIATAERERIEFRRREQFINDFIEATKVLVDMKNNPLYNEPEVQNRIASGLI